jgi:hypothetical protein
MNETTDVTIELPAPTAMTRGEVEGDFATGERTEPKDEATELLEGDFAAGERTTSEITDADPDADLHGDFAAGERTEPIEAQAGSEGTFADTTT